jgi:hypothetical protein
MLMVETNSSTSTNDILIDPTFNVYYVDTSVGFNVDNDAYRAAQKLLRLQSDRSFNIVDNIFSTDPPEDNDDEDYLTGPPDHFFDDSPKFQPPFFGHLVSML